MTDRLLGTAHSMADDVAALESELEMLRTSARVSASELEPLERRIRAARTAANELRAAERRPLRAGTLELIRRMIA